jgi:hypothetical protein
VDGVRAEAPSAGASASSSGAIAGAAAGVAACLISVGVVFFLMRRRRLLRERSAATAGRPAPPPLFAPHASPLAYGPPFATPYAGYPYPSAPPRPPADKPALLIRRQESHDGTGDPRPVDVNHETEAAELFGPWPAECVVCGNLLVQNDRVRLDSEGNAVCRECACGALRASPVTPINDTAVTMVDAVAELCEGSRHVPAGAPSLTAAEVARVRDAIARDTHQHPARWEVVSCPNCRGNLTVPAAVHVRGGPLVCHQCTHRVCTRCDAVFNKAVVPPQPGRPPQTHVGITCDAVARLRAQDANNALSREQMRNLGIKACPFCGTLTNHFRGHACHHISPQGGCPGCHRDYCFASLKPYAQCRSEGHQGHALFCDRRCDCVDCPICKPGKP